MAQKKYIYGYHTIAVAMDTMSQGVKRLFLQPKEREQRLRELVALASQHQIAITYLSKEQLDQMLPLTKHQGAIAEINYLGEYTEDYLRVILDRHGENILLLILDGVQDSHNLGACLRTANAAGVHGVIIPKDRACGLTPIVYKVASGAVGVTPIIPVTNLARTMNLLKRRNIWIYGASEEAQSSLHEITFKTPLAMVFGAEGDGLRRLTKDNCDLLFKIPMRGVVQNLNVSVAVGIGLFSVLQ